MKADWFAFMVIVGMLCVFYGFVAWIAGWL